MLAIALPFCRLSFLPMTWRAAVFYRAASY
jgi:hypothetical protein